MAAHQHCLSLPPPLLSGPCSLELRLNLFLESQEQPSQRKLVLEGPCQQLASCWRTRLSADCVQHCCFCQRQKGTSTAVFLHQRSCLTVNSRDIPRLSAAFLRHQPLAVSRCPSVPILSSKMVTQAVTQCAAGCTAAAQRPARPCRATPVRSGAAHALCSAVLCGQQGREAPTRQLAVFMARNFIPWPKH